jgi:hypothetical protein
MYSQGFRENSDVVTGVMRQFRCSHKGFSNVKEFEYHTSTLQMGVARYSETLVPTRQFVHGVIFQTTVTHYHFSSPKPDIAAAEADLLFRLLEGQSSNAVPETGYPALDLRDCSLSVVPHSGTEPCTMPQPPSWKLFAIHYSLWPCRSGTQTSLVSAGNTTQ